jgi:hypothetical protein
MAETVPKSTLPRPKTSSEAVRSNPLIWDALLPNLFPARRRKLRYLPFRILFRLAHFRVSTAPTIYQDAAQADMFTTPDDGCLDRVHS